MNSDLAKLLIYLGIGLLVAIITDIIWYNFVDNDMDDFLTIFFDGWIAFLWPMFLIICVIIVPLFFGLTRLTDYLDEKEYAKKQEMLKVKKEEKKDEVL